MGPRLYIGPALLEQRARWFGSIDRVVTSRSPPRRPARTYPRLSPDGTRAALEIWDENRDIWVWDFARETLTRLTDTPGRDGFPVWTPDSARLIFGSARSDSTNLYWRAAGGTGPVERITESALIQFPYSISPSGKQLTLREDNLETGLDISLVSLDGERRTTPLLRTVFNELNAEISPDGKWLAYQSNESGQDGSTCDLSRDQQTDSKCRPMAARGRSGTATCVNCSPGTGRVAGVTRPRPQLKCDPRSTAAISPRRHSSGARTTCHLRAAVLDD
jgi:Tol biopolymer transport system component